MTGEELCNLKRGATITIETPFSEYKKGQVLKVEYIDNTDSVVYIRDTSKPLGSQIDLVPFGIILDNFAIGGKLPEKDNNKVIEFPFAIGDTDYETSDDKVNHPSHYTWLKDLCEIEVIDITRHMDFNLGNSIKYILRSGHKKEEGYTDKQKTIEDLKKAIWYLNDEIKLLSNE